ncbi:MAG: CBS domain-containing protein [Planctomycetota bacterium]|nr:CBS domain-containing protein [Planctomycetota bacterium]
MSLTQLGTRDVVTLPHDATVQDAVRWMVEANVGSVIVMRGRAPCGIVTDRDLVVRVLATGDNPIGTQLSAVMSTGLITATDDCPVDEAAWRMREHKVRRLPIIDEQGELHGLVCLDDLIGKVASMRGDVAEILASFHAPYQSV